VGHGYFSSARLRHRRRRLRGLRARPPAIGGPGRAGATDRGRRRGHQRVDPYADRVRRAVPQRRGLGLFLALRARMQRPANLSAARQGAPCGRASTISRETSTRGGTASSPRQRSTTSESRNPICSQRGATRKRWVRSRPPACTALCGQPLPRSGPKTSSQDPRHATLGGQHPRSRGVRRRAFMVANGWFCWSGS
jgi:hypothetical protein